MHERRVLVRAVPPSVRRGSAVSSVPAWRGPADTPRDHLPEISRGAEYSVIPTAEDPDYRPQSGPRALPGTVRIALEPTSDFHCTLTHRMLRRDSPWSRSRRSSPLRRHVPWPAGQRIACGLLVVSAARGSGEKVAIWPKNSHLPGTPPALAHSGTEIFRKRFSSFPDTVLGWLVAHGLPSYPPDTGHGRFLCVPGMGPLSGITQGRARSAEATDI